MSQCLPGETPYHKISTSYCNSKIEDVRKSDFETLLNSLEHVLVLIGADKGDGKTLSTETTGTTDTVKIGVGISRQVIVDSQVDALNINTTSEDVGSDADSLVELLELLVSANTDDLLDSMLHTYLANELTVPPG